jgi:hypothetical protein
VGGEKTKADLACDKKSSFFCRGRRSKKKILNIDLVARSLCYFGAKNDEREV